MVAKIFFFAKQFLSVAAAQIRQHSSASDWWAVYCGPQELSKNAIKVSDM